MGRCTCGHTKHFVATTVKITKRKYDIYQILKYTVQTAHSQKSTKSQPFPNTQRTIRMVSRRASSATNQSSQGKHQRPHQAAPKASKSAAPAQSSREYIYKHDAANLTCGVYKSTNYTSILRQISPLTQPRIITHMSMQLSRHFRPFQDNLYPFTYEASRQTTA